MPYDLVIKNGWVVEHPRTVVTFSNGEVLLLLRDGKHTGALPGRLLRGPLALRP